MMKPGLVVALGIALCVAGAGPAAAECKVSRMLDLPVTLVGGFRPMVEAKINGIDGRFIADSGAFYSIISPGAAAAAKLRLQDAPPWYLVTGIGGSQHVAIARVKDFTLAGVALHNIDFIVGGTDVGTTGLLGQNVLGLADVEYDLPHGMIRLFRSSGCGDRALAYWVGKGGTYSQVKIDETNEQQRHTLLKVTVNGVELNALLDTGAPRTAISKEAAARLGIHPGDPGVQPNGSASGLGRKTAQSWSAPFARFGIGDEEIRNIRLEVIDADLGRNIDVIIGGDFIISHRIYVDNSARRLFFTYSGGTVFERNARVEGEVASAAAPPGGGPADPVNADDFSRRGAVAMVQRNYGPAIEDFSRAIALAPKDPRYLVQRAEAYLRSGRINLGASDVNRAVELDPSNVDARLVRARLRASIAERDGALTDLDAAAAALTGPVNQRLEVAEGYIQLEAYDRAIAQIDPWLAAHPDDVRRAQALNQRCWARGLAGKALDKALDDCNDAVKLRRGNPQYLDSRGLVNLRLGRYDAAIADYDAALKATPKEAWSLYGRSLAHRHKGETAAADADLKAAVALAPGIPDRARRAGIE